MSGQLFQQVHDNTASKCGTYKHSFSHQSILHDTYKHSLCTPRHITWYILTFIFTPRHIIWYIQTYIFHTKAYCNAHANHSYCTPVYKTRSSFELCHSCIRFHIVRSFNTSDAHSARPMSTANCFCYSQMRDLLKRALHCKTHTWGPRWCTTSRCGVHSIKYGCHMSYNSRQAIPFCCFSSGLHVCVHSSGHYVGHKL